MSHVNVQQQFGCSLTGADSSMNAQPQNCPVGKVHEGWACSSQLLTGGANSVFASQVKPCMAVGKSWKLVLHTMHRMTACCAEK